MSIANPDPARLARAERLLRAHAGLDLRGDAARLALLDEALARRGAAAVESALARDDALFATELASDLAIGETTFFRYPGHFELLRRSVLPALLERGRPTRIWSAGCATGEEAYSIAQVLVDELGDGAADRATVLATDLNERFLERAGRAVYGEWSFRDVDPIRRAAAFRRVPGGLTPDPRARALVSFRRFDLVTEEPEALGPPFDVVFCRNVLIYFDRATARRVLARLCGALGPGGWLFTGHSELGLDADAPLAIVEAPDALVYRRLAEPPRAAPRPAAPPPPGVEPRPTPSRPASPGDRDLARHLHEEALALYERRDDAGAAELLRRSLYLDPARPDVHFLASVVARRRGDAAAERRHLGVALSLASRRDDGERLAEDLTVGGLRRLVRERQKELGA